MKQTFLTSTNYTALHDAFRSPSAAFLKSDVHAALGRKYSEPNRIPALLLKNMDRITGLNKLGLGMICLEPIPILELMNKASQHYPAQLQMYPFSLQEIEHLEGNATEYPRQGLCLVSRLSIVNGSGLNFLEQTYLLMDFVISVFPELQASMFYKTSIAELKTNAHEIVHLISVGQQDEAVIQLQNLSINYHFRPKVSELLQYAFMHQLRFGYPPFREAVWTNSCSLTKRGFLKLGYVDEKIVIRSVEPDVKRFATIHLPFILDLEWLETVIG